MADPTGKMPPHIRVDLQQPDGQWRHAGIFLVEEKVRGFLYHKDYDGVALDPVHLDWANQGRRFPGGGALGDGSLPNVLRAQLPGVFAWGLLSEARPELETLDEARRLHALGSITRGAIRLTVSGGFPEWPVVHGWKGLERARKAAVAGYLRRLEEAMPEDLLRSFSAGEAGARPKASVRLTDGSDWIAKFNTPRDPYNVARVEYLMHRLAECCDIETVDSHVVGLAGDDVLLLRRYDRTEHGAIYRVALADLIDKENIEPGTRGSVDYLDLLAPVRRLAPDDVGRLYQQMLFHAAVNNTDNHARNFELLATASGWRLAPAFDVLPDPGLRAPFATAMCRYPRREIDLDFIERTADRFGVSPALAVPVLSGLVHLPDLSEEAGLVPAQARMLQEAIRPETLAELAGRIDPGAIHDLSGWTVLEPD